MLSLDSFITSFVFRRLNPHSFSPSDPKAETRLYVTVNGFEFHVYNRTDLYARLQETFGLESTLMTPKKDEERGRKDSKKTLERSEQLSPSGSFELSCF